MNKEMMPIYVGFWQRVLASLIDTAIVALISAPLMYLVYGEMHPQTDVFIIGQIGRAHV